MNTFSRIISGIVAIIIGVFVIAVAIADGADTWSVVWGVAWGLFVSGIGIYLFFNKNEDTIEEIKIMKK